MPRYMMFITHSEDYRNYPIPKALHDEMGHFANENLESGVLIDASGFEPTSAAKCVRLSRGKLTVTDGPFAEAKEVIGGYALVETPLERRGDRLRHHGHGHPPQTLARVRGSL